ncbi:hypothetical protein DL768_002742 [Monosporascus sp. mg162]|nr:hypothetical protein DL768_002742 [Monosporascus sp. mg162]
MVTRTLPDIAASSESTLPGSSRSETRFQYQAPSPSILVGFDTCDYTDNTVSLEGSSAHSSCGRDAMGGSSSKEASRSGFRYVATEPDIFELPIRGTNLKNPVDVYETDFKNKKWDEISCPECRATMGYEDVEQYADRETFAKYSDLALRGAVNQAPDFVWCPNGCESGQIHEDGNEKPIVTCVKCSFKFCFRHQVRWHEQLTCAEYDSFVSDPENFRSRIEILNEEAEKLRLDEQLARRTQEEADQKLAQSLMAAEQREEAERQAQRERAERERREEAERRRLQAERMAMQQKAEKMRMEAARKREEDELSRRTVERTTKPCPGCKWPIEKNSGCSHMTYV